MAQQLGLKALSFVSRIFAGAIEAAQAITCRRKEPADHSWQKPSPGDSRSPCPMINALANHGYLPRDGKDVSLSRLITAFKEAINLAPDATLIVGLKALQTSTTRNPFTFHLSDLAKHGVIEHDGSLSRHDLFSPAGNGDNHSFAPEIWATVAAHFEGAETISIATAARARNERVAAARATNPRFELPKEHERFSFIETSLYLRVFGEGTEGEARREWVRAFFEEERLPIEEGFRRSEKLLKTMEILELQKKLEAETAKLA